jgi:hypothetical protein
MFHTGSKLLAGTNNSFKHGALWMNVHVSGVKLSESCGTPVQTRDLYIMGGTTERTVEIKAKVRDAQGRQLSPERTGCPERPRGNCKRG